ncbi:MAG: HAD family hydrolase, partial [Phycisphaerae bacterium]|nr:HAD family hydrolase [Phycisphaerae bacterium]
MPSDNATPINTDRKYSFLPGSDIEIINPDAVRGRIRQALFDFDGTVSLVREGWQKIMEPLMVEFISQLPHTETDEQLGELVRDKILETTGKQTIYQMYWLAEEIERRGGEPLEPIEYKSEYLRRLEKHIKDRVAGLAEGRIEPLDMIVTGAFDILENFRARGIRMYCASGTDQPFARREAELLGATPFFDGGLWGALDDPSKFSKKMVIEKIIAASNLSGPELVAFGDGFVEIEEAKAIGGLAVGVATNEAERCGIDPW